MPSPMKCLREIFFFHRNRILFQNAYLKKKHKTDKNYKYELEKLHDYIDDVRRMEQTMAAHGIKTPEPDWFDNVIWRGGITEKEYIKTKKIK